LGAGRPRVAGTRSCPPCHQLVAASSADRATARAGVVAPTIAAEQAFIDHEDAHGLVGTEYAPR
jgi:hypothetical protein